MADETPTLGKVLEKVYDEVKFAFEGLRDMFLKKPKQDLCVKYIEAKEVTRSEDRQIITVTNN